MALEKTENIEFIWSSEVVEIVAETFDDVLAAEDIASTGIAENLTTYKERLLLEDQLKKVPQSKRQVFFVRL